MSNILIDIPDLEKKNGGVYQYAEALIKTLAGFPSSHSFFVFCKNPSSELKEIINKTSNFSFTRSFIPHKTKKKKLWDKITCKVLSLIGRPRICNYIDIYDTIINDHNINIIHTPYQNLVKKPGIRSITTLHDVQELHFPEFFSSEERAHRAVKYKRAIDGADAVVVSYDHVKKDIKKYFDKPEEMIFPVLLDMQNLWISQVKNTSEDVLKIFGLPDNYLLYPAATWAHKNHLKLLEAIKEISAPEINLVCTGHKTEFFMKHIYPKIEELGLKNNVTFLGIVSNEELFKLYQGCKAVVIPTLYEAGSFPLMESILLGIPVICSNVTSLPTTIGDERFTFDPYNMDDIALKVRKIWYDDEFRQENLSLIKVQADKMRGNHAASEIHFIYDTLIRGHEEIK